MKKIRNIILTWDVFLFFILSWTPKIFIYSYMAFNLVIFIYCLYKLVFIQFNKYYKKKYESSSKTETLSNSLIGIWIAVKEDDGEGEDEENELEIIKRLPAKTVN